MSETLEQRVEALEKQVASLLQGHESKPTGREWVDDLYGKFAGDPVFAHAMKLGRKYRQSLRPSVRKTRPKK